MHCHCFLQSFLSYNHCLRQAVPHGNRRYHQPLCHYPSCNYGMGSNGNLKMNKNTTISQSLSNWIPFTVKSMAWRKTAVTLLQTHWCYCSRALSHRNMNLLCILIVGYPNIFTGFVCIANYEKQTVQIQINFDRSYKIIWIFQLVIWVRTGIKYLMFLLM